ncbi:hypothetical protein GF420_02340 [candidate division GN15 bacterium]|nr:hypothetical protein [candidate division GN15 bacterium]
MASLAHRVEYLLARAAHGLANSLSARSADRLGGAAGRLVGLLLSSRRRIAHDNLRRALGDTLTEAERQRIVKNVFASIGRTFFEVARFPRLTPENVQQTVVRHGFDAFDQALEAGRGAILVVPHFGNWELSAATVALSGYPIDVLVTTQHNPLVDRMMTELRTSTGVGVIRLGSAARQAYKALKNNRVIGIAADQHAPAGELVLDFFGRPASVAKGPARFAIRAGAPILPYVILRERYDRHVMLPGEPIYPPESGDEETNIRRMTEQFLRYFEERIREYPDQWMWTHRRWKLERK